MNGRRYTKWIQAVIVLAVLSAAVAGAADAPTPTVAEQMAALQTMCTDTEQARAQRQADEALYDRLGGYDRIHEFTREVVRLHNQNDAIKHMFAHVDSENLAKQVADFVASGTGGPQSYTGRAMPAAHARLELTDADFLSAGGDIVTAMQTMGYGQDEIDEIVCILVSLKDQVVFE
jgi:hemoglobin